MSRYTRVNTHLLSDLYLISGGCKELRKDTYHIMLEPFYEAYIENPKKRKYVYFYSEWGITNDLLRMLINEYK